MGTTLGRWLTLLNVSMSIGMLSWALSAYLNRVDWLDKTNGEIPKIKAEIDDMMKAVAASQAEYGRRRDKLQFFEDTKELRHERFNDRLEQARNGVFRVQLPTREGELGDEIFTDVEKEGDEVPGTNPNDKHLRGVKAINKNFADEVALIREIRGGKSPLKNNQLDQLGSMAGNAAEFQKFIEGLGTNELPLVMKKLSELIEVNDFLMKRQRDIRDSIKDETKFLGDGRVDWITRLQTLELRRTQLEGRLKELGVDPNSIK